jgi:uncharacterized membrane protein YqjE
MEQAFLKLFSILKKYLRKIHGWMKNEPEDVKLLKLFSKIFMSMAGIIFGILIVPGAHSHIGYILDIDKVWAGAILSLFFLIILGILYCIWGIINECCEKHIEIPTKYQLILSIFSLPLAITFHKFVVPLLKPLLNNYEQKNIGDR